jgi:hypothetical protein
LTRRAIERSDSRCRLTFVKTVDAEENGASGDLGGLEPALHGAYWAGCLETRRYQSGASHWQIARCRGGESTNSPRQAQAVYLVTSGNTHQLSRTHRLLHKPVRWTNRPSRWQLVRGLAACVLSRRSCREPTWFLLYGTSELVDLERIDL